MPHYPTISTYIGLTLIVVGLPGLFINWIWLGSGFIIVGLIFVIGDAAGNRNSWFWRMFDK